MKFIVSIEETRSKCFEVEADSYEEAELAAVNAYDSGEINLDSSDTIDSTEFHDDTEWYKDTCGYNFSRIQITKTKSKHICTNNT